MRYGLVLWDFDGTLADTLPLLLRAYNDLATAAGYRVVSDPQVVRGQTLLELLRSQGIPRARLPLLARRLRRAVKGEMAGVPLFPGLAEVLADLRRGGCRLGVLSSNSRENVLSCLRANGVDDLFEVVAGYPLLFGKARGIRRLLRSLGVDRAEALYVGDEVRDVEAAHKAGVAVAAVTWGLNARTLLEGYRPAFLVDRPDQLPGCLGGG
jgi:phosphoglycolate phosphatase